MSIDGSSMADRPLGPEGGYKVTPAKGGKLLGLGVRVAPLAGLSAYFLLKDGLLKSGAAPFAARNAAAQLAVFAVGACLPCARTGRMSYVDVAWPWGLFAIGINAGASGTAPALRRRLAALMYCVNGGKMGLMGLAWWNLLDKEFTRYLYRRLCWERDPFFFGLVTSTPASMQLEILEQAVWNIFTLSVPALLLAFDDTPGTSTVEAAGYLIWAVSTCLEVMGDAQKLKFVNKCKKAGVKVRRQEVGGQVCNEGLWRYSRHPNYFFQWAAWLGIVLSSAPSLLRLRGRLGAESPAGWAALAAALGWIPFGMYHVMVWYTGCVPAEMYSAETRPGYARYQQETNMFFPAPPRLRGGAEEKRQ